MPLSGFSASCPTRPYAALAALGTTTNPSTVHHAAMRRCMSLDAIKFTLSEDHVMLSMRHDDPMLLPVSCLCHVPRKRKHTTRPAWHAMPSSHVDHDAWHMDRSSLALQTL